MPVYGGHLKQVPNFFIRIADDYEAKDVFEPKQLSFYWTPDQISDSVSVSWSEVSVIGRSEPWVAYQNTGPRIISFSVIFQAVGRSATDEESLIQEVKKPVDWLRSLQYPVYFNNKMVRPPILMLVWGKLFAIRCYCEEASVTWQMPFDPKTLLPHRAEVSLSFKRIGPTALSAEDVLKGVC